MSFFLLPLSKRNRIETFCFYSSAFSEEECDKVISLFDRLKPEDSAIGLPDNGQILHDKRKSKTHWLSWAEEHNWLFDKLSGLVQDANNARYQYELTGFLEPLQLTEYQAPGDHYDWHQDYGPSEFSVRKMSLVVQLSPPEDYEGGELEFFTTGPITKKDRGTVYVFPAFEQHRVTPITSGCRRSLVCWIAGPPFR